MFAMQYSTLSSRVTPPYLGLQTHCSELLGQSLDRGYVVDLNGKVAFVTGGSGDIGGAIARALRERARRCRFIRR